MMISRPILVTTPRTGSTAIANFMSCYADRYLGFAGNAKEAFVVTQLYERNFSVQSNGNIRVDVVRPRVTPLSDEDAERSQALAFLINIGKPVMIKYLTHDVSHDVQEYMASNYQPVFLERRDVVSQFISFASLASNPAHFTKSSQPPRMFQYHSVFLDRFIAMLANYDRIKNKHPQAPVLVYEDLMDNTLSMSMLCKQLGWVEPHDMCTTDTIPTPYIMPLEDMITNKNEWFRDKPRLLEVLKNR